jgi:hypothetical protein
MGRSTEQESTLSEIRKYRRLTAQQKTEIVLASLRGPTAMGELCRVHDIADRLRGKWREPFLAAGRSACRARPSARRPTSCVAGSRGCSGRRGARRWGRGRGGTLAGLGVSVRAARSRELVAQGPKPIAVARAAGISRPAIDRRPARPPAGQRRAPDATDRIVRDAARCNPTDGTRMVAALAARRAPGPVNRQRAQRLMREHALLQPKRSDGRRRRPGSFQVTRPDERWPLDTTSVWVAEHGWCYPNAATDCCTREIVARALDVRCRATEATAVVDAALAARSVTAGGR